MDWDLLERAVDGGWIAGVVRAIKSGKEATVYLCRGTDTSAAELVAAKVYREREQRSFRNDAVYWEGAMRTYRRREKLAATKKTTFGKGVRFGGWVSREWETLRAAAAAGVSVPRPIERIDGLILMDWVGDEDEAAPQLRHSGVRGAEAEAVFDQVLEQMELMLAANIVHADLSEFNVLLTALGRPVVIDFPQAVDPRFNRQARSLLERDLANLARFFASRGAPRDVDAVTNTLWQCWLHSELGAADDERSPGIDA